MDSQILHKAYAKYVNFVTENVELIGEVEAALKWISYFIAGRGGEISPVLSELIYSVSNVLTLVNDTILRCAMAKVSSMSSSTDHFKMALTVIEYLEVFAEVGSRKVWGSTGKWLVIAIIQILKTVLRLVLLFKEKSGFLFSPPVQPLTARQRTMVKHRLGHPQVRREGGSVQPEVTTSSKVRMSFTLKRSGRTVRTISSAPPILGRTWKTPLEPPPATDRDTGWSPELAPTPLDGSQKLAEIFHIVRPVAHLIAMGAFGPASWTPWTLSCALDIASLRLVRASSALNVAERGELRFRTIAVIYYLLRSPFYDRFTKERIIRLLATLSANVPGAKFICKPLMEYLPSWQRTYFYAWGC